LLEGLEISEVFLSYVFTNEVFRFDSNYFLKKFLIEEQIIRNHFYKTLEKINVEIKSFGAYSLNNYVNYETCGIPFIRGINMKKGRIVFNDILFINEEANKILYKSEVKPEMVLLSMSGTIGDVAIASKSWKYPINSNQDIAKIDTKCMINPYYLYIFLLSKFGQNYLIREARGSVQQHVFLSQIEKFEIPVLNYDFIKLIERTIKLSEDKLIQSDIKYQQAETTLFESVGLKNFGHNKENVNIKHFKDSFFLTGRLDAEYYQKKYENYIKLIKDYVNGYNALNVVCNLIDNNFIPEENTEYKYIELANIGKTGDITECTKNIGKELPSRARRKVSTGDIMVSSIEGSLGSCAFVQHEYDNALCSTGFYVVNSNRLNSETLLVLFKSEPMQNLLKQACSGSILSAINKNEFQNIPVPMIETPVQNQISELIKESFQLKKESENLLELAKRVVEVAIEEGEEFAMKIITH